MNYSCGIKSEISQVCVDDQIQLFDRIFDFFKKRFHKKMIIKNFEISKSDVRLHRVVRSDISSQFRSPAMTGIC